jgi:hypothetical protein
MQPVAQSDPIDEFDDVRSVSGLVFPCKAISYTVRFRCSAIARLDCNEASRLKFYDGECGWAAPAVWSPIRQNAVETTIMPIDVVFVVLEERSS